MPKVWEIWNKEHDIAVLYWDRRPSDFPLGPINSVLAKFYNQQISVYPYFYAVYKDNVEIGLLMAGSFEVPLGEEDVFYSLLQEIIDSEKTVPEQDPTYRMLVHDV